VGSGFAAGSIAGAGDLDFGLDWGLSRIVVVVVGCMLGFSEAKHFERLPPMHCTHSSLAHAAGTQADWVAAGIAGSALVLVGWFGADSSNSDDTCGRSGLCPAENIADARFAHTGSAEMTVASIGHTVVQNMGDVEK